jgi:hypothetical protein
MQHRSIVKACTVGLLVVLVANAAIAQDGAADPALAALAAEKAKFDAQKAQYDAEAAAAKAKFGTLGDYAATGSVEAGTEAGKLEAMLLGSEATRATAEKIATQVCATVAGCKEPEVPKGATKVKVAEKPVCSAVTTAIDPNPIFIVADEEKISYEAYDTFRFEAELIRRNFTAASALEPGGGAAPGTLTVETTGFTTALALAGNLLRSDYKVSAVTLTPDNLVLAKEVIRAARCKKMPRHLILPGLYSLPLSVADNTAIATIEDLDKLRATALGRQVRFANEAKRLEDDAKAEKDKKKGATMLAEAAANGAVVDSLKAAIKRYDDFVAKLGAADDKGAIPFATIARQAYMASKLEAGAYLLALKSNFLGGSAYTKKNFFTFFGSMPFSVSGGAISSFSLIEGKTGDVVDSGIFAHAAPFAKVHKTIGRYSKGNPP